MTQTTVRAVAPPTPDDARVAFVTCAGRPALQPDDALAAAVLARRGIRVEPLPWNAAGPPPGAFDLVVLRSTWDYHLSPERFVEWLARVEASGVPVLNPPERVRWNLSKRYLAELEAAGVPVVPTRWLDAGAAAELADSRASWEATASS